MPILLGLKPPADDNHLRRYSLSAETMPSIPTPVGLGSEWYGSWFDPYRDSNDIRWLVKPGLENKPDQWGAVAGGHAYTLKPAAVRDDLGWWEWYDQQRNDCTAYSASRMMSLLNRQRYYAPPVYDDTLTHDEWQGEADQGTSVRATMDTIRDKGMWRLRRGFVVGPNPADGIAANRWCRNVYDLAYCLDPESQGARILRQGWAHMLNSWGYNYPHLVRVQLEVIEYVIFASGWGDATLVTDR